MTSKINLAKQTLARVRATISRFEMIQRNDRVIVAVSGGADSISLLHLLHALKDSFSMHLVVAHYEHGLRPMEDPAETGFVQQFAASLGHPFESEKGTLSIGRGASIEEIRFSRTNERKTHGPENRAGPHPQRSG
jgi:tRNA(Ile)-lysidine synthase